MTSNPITTDTLTTTEKGFKIIPDSTGQIRDITIRLMCTETVLSNRVVSFKIRNGNGISGTILYASNFNITPSSTPVDTPLIISNGPSLLVGNSYTITMTDITNPTGSGYINFYGTYINGINISYNTGVYPKLSYSNSISTNNILWQQPTDTGVDSVLDGTEQGWEFTPTQSGTITDISIYLSAYEFTTPPRSVRLRIRSGSGLSGSVLFNSTYNISNTTPTDYTFTIAGPSVVAGNTYTVSLQDTSPPGNNGYVNIYGIQPSIFKVAYNTSVYPKINIKSNNVNFAQIGNKLVATGVTNQGFLVSMSADGTTLAVGGVIYTQSGGIWTEQTKLPGNTTFGSVSLSSDGNTLAVGVPDDNLYAGAVLVFVRSGGVWTQQGNKLVGSGAIGNARQGTAVAISADGNTIVSTGTYDNNVGATWVFTRSGGVWTQQGNKLVGSGGTVLGQGTSVCISGDGNTFAIGNPADNFPTYTGAVWVFTRSGGVWTQQGGKIIATGAIGDASQGNGISLSYDGSTLAIGGSNDNSGIGAVWIFTGSGGTYTQQQKLIGSGNVGQSSQGYSVSLSTDGNTVAFSGRTDNNNIGAAWVFTRSAGVWSQKGGKLVGSGNSGQSLQGQSITLSGDGYTFAMGGNQDNSNVGATWIFSQFIPLYSQSVNNTFTSPIPSTEIGFRFSPPSTGVINNLQIKVMGVGTTGSRDITFRIRQGGGVSGTVLWSQIVNIPTTLTRTIIPVSFSIPASVNATFPYTLTAQDTASSGSGIIYFYGIASGGSYTTYNTTTYPNLLLSATTNNSTPVQQADFTVSDTLSISSEKGFLIVPTTDGTATVASVLLSGFDAVNASRSITLKIRSGAGVGGSVIYSNVYSYTPSTAPLSYSFALPDIVLTGGNQYTFTLTDSTANGNASGSCMMYGIWSNSSYTSYNSLIYPQLTIGSYNNATQWSQPLNPTIFDSLSSTEKGWNVVSGASGVLTKITIALSSYSTGLSRSVRLRIRSGSGVSGSILYSSVYVLPNLTTPVNYDFTGFNIITVKNQVYTITLTDLTSLSTGNTWVYGVYSSGSYISYNTTVYPYLITNIPTYIVTLSPPQNLSEFLADGTDNIELNTRSFDNSNGIYTTTFHTKNSMYLVSLKTLTIPNALISVSNGGKLDNYPFLYFTLLNEGSGNNIKTLMSNNENSVLATFKVQIDKDLYGKPTYFFTLKNLSGPQLLKFRPDQDIRFRLTLPDGTIIKNQIADYLSPLSPNPLLQINAVISIRPFK